MKLRDGAVLLIIGAAVIIAAISITSTFILWERIGDFGEAPGLVSNFIPGKEALEKAKPIRQRRAEAILYEAPILVTIGAAVLGPIEHSEPLTTTEKSKCAYRVHYTDRKDWDDLSVTKKRWCNFDIRCRRVFTEIGAVRGRWYHRSSFGLGDHQTEAGPGLSLFQMVPFEWFPDAWAYRGERVYCIPAPSGLVR